METSKEESVLKCELCKTYPRLEGTNKCESCYSVVRHVLEQNPRFKDALLPDLRKKQESLEGAAEKYLQEWRLLNNIHLSNPIHAQRCKNDFIAGAKWQAERMYSEEEAGELVYNVIGEYAKHY